MLVRQSRFGAFLGCSNYPKCRTNLKIDANGDLLPDQNFACTFSESGGTKGRRGTTRKTTSTAAKKTTTRTTKNATAAKPAPKRRSAPKAE
jgi:ssDNA-binding Zn-finger/Zn-ribbon topoisomerase 1